MIQEERIKALNTNSPVKGNYVLYWMQQSQRAEYNHALEYAAYRANEMNLPLVACFGLTDSYPQAQERHYLFMLQGLRETFSALRNRGIALVIRRGEPDRVAVEMSGDAAVAVTDRGYLRHQRTWRDAAASSMKCPLVQVETDVIVPIEAALTKEAWSAGILRPRLLRCLESYIQPLKERRLKKESLGLNLPSESLEDIRVFLSGLSVKREVKGLDWIRGGTGEAKGRLNNFIEKRLSRVPEDRNDPSKQCLSRMSPYLHFGQISPLYIAMKIMEHPSPGADIFLEELIVRRELAMNFVYYNDTYDSWECLPPWARNTLEEHGNDPREYIYSLEELESGKTHDPFWNAAQAEMVSLGLMHGYMRMYWGKKILEWSPHPREAFRRALYLNNKYGLDGRDANGYAGVAWCFGKHDRAWGGRPVFGKVRYMNDRGLLRKFNMKEYITMVEARNMDEAEKRDRIAADE